MSCFFINVFEFSSGCVVLFLIGGGLFASRRSFDLFFLLIPVYHLGVFWDLFFCFSLELHGVTCFGCIYLFSPSCVFSGLILPLGQLS